ncbi:M28 family peptidase [Silvibacterium dinghuense]|uniref:M28 family peptidase n=1 Tax=Silvibacterium dinghuense TaxID=1560006 RepID=A0A4Q1SGK9_9BACT|nr:M28 family peptidase [Silvibacterium dinghuense]RXS96485.1 M28 family peptidase [Silvibacterium dinghuense]GGG91162.1 peptidase M28 [Silvibacterium dinghuense]
MRLALALFLLVAAVPAVAQRHPRDGELHDADTTAWWHTTEALSNDAMEGRDTGSAAYQRAAEYVADRFHKAGLSPAGEHGSYFQSVPMNQIEADPIASLFTLLRSNGDVVSIGFLTQITISPMAGLLPDTEAPLTFRGYCGKDAMQDIAGKIVVCFGTQRSGLPSGGERVANARAGHAAGLVNVDDPYFSIEPPRWPYAYARSVTLASESAPIKPETTPLPVMRLSAEAFTTWLKGTPYHAASLLETGGRQQPLPSFDIPARLHIHLRLGTRTLSSPNVLAVLPGSDPVLRDQYVVIAAHLDGYGYGTSVDGDALYNGTLDDAAYVALLIQFADDLKREHLQPKRSILFCAFTGEEKGLLGSSWFVEHPTVPASQLAADINLDQLRPLFPLHILTALAVDDTTLGATARKVGASMDIEIRPDREPERGLLRRADHYPFLRSGVPAIGFIFGYDPGTDAETRYREWYRVRYHRPQDDLTQPVDFDAAAKFDHFFYKLVEAVADDPKRPAILPESSFAKPSQK